jgi:hypothetical protein
MTSCWHCHNPIENNNFARLDSCVHCGRDTRACKNCEHYDIAYNNLCRESSADRVVEKEKGNFCDYFKPSGQMKAAGLDPAAKARAAAEALFKKK